MMDAGVVQREGRRVDVRGTGDQQRQLTDGTRRVRHQALQQLHPMLAHGDDGGRIEQVQRIGEGGVQATGAFVGVQRQIETLGEAEVSTKAIGEMVMEGLRQLDSVAYIRFASVYKRFQDLNEFREEIDRLSREPIKG